MASRAVLGVLFAAAAAWLLWFGASSHLQRSCVVSDTPYLELCPTTAPDADPDRQEELRARLRRNPGEARVWVALASVESGEAQQHLLHAATALAPTDPDVLRLRAQQALAQHDMALATELLVKMTNYRIGGTEPPQILGRLLATGEGAALLRPHLVADSNWLPPVLAAMAALKLPVDSALPLLTAGATTGILSQQAVASTVRALKADGKWLEAYSLWATQQPKPAPILFNGSFDHRFQAGGFDWEATPSSPGRAGAVIVQRTMADHGQVLEIQYTGRAVPPFVIRQFLVLPAGRYALNGQYMTSKLRMEQGLAWAVRCMDGTKLLAGRSEPMRDTEDAWRNFGFEFKIPEDCGDVASLQLETVAPFEAATGFRGKAFFDDFELRHLAR